MSRVILGFNFRANRVKNRAKNQVLRVKIKPENKNFKPNLSRVKSILCQVRKNIFESKMELEIIVFIGPLALKNCLLEPTHLLKNKILLPTLLISSQTSQNRGGSSHLEPSHFKLASKSSRAGTWLDPASSRAVQVESKARSSPI